MTEELHTVIVDCASGSTTHRPMTNEEAEEHQAAQTDASAAMEQTDARSRARAEAIDALKNHSDPALRAIAEHL